MWSLFSWGKVILNKYSSDDFYQYEIIQNALLGPVSRIAANTKHLSRPEKFWDCQETGPWRESDRFFLDLPVVIYLFISHWSRAVFKSWGPGISPGYYECGPWLLSLENRRKIEPKEILSCLIPHLLVVFTQQLEILMTTLLILNWKQCSPSLPQACWSHYCIWLVYSYGLSHCIIINYFFNL